MEPLQESPAPQHFAQRVPPETLLIFRALLVVGGLSTRALWREEPESVPQLLPLVAAVEALTGLTAADGEALRACSKSDEAAAREVLMRPGRFYLFIALGLATYESALAGSPLLPMPPHDPQLALTHTMAAQVYELIESHEQGEVTDLPLDFDPFANGGDPFGSAEAEADSLGPGNAADDEAPDDADEPTADEAEENGARVYPVDELRLARLQLGTLFAHHEPALRDVALADWTRYPSATNQGADEADDPQYDDFFHDRCLHLEITFVTRALAVTSLATSAYWFLSAAVPFARAAAGLRWLRRREAVTALMKRLSALEYGPQAAATAMQEVDLSLAETLTLYQAQESVALALLNDEVLEAIAALSARETLPEGTTTTDDLSDDKPVHNHTDWLRHELDPATPLGKLFMHHVPGFAALLQEHLTEDAATELAAARAEVAALAELATSPGAV